MTDAMDLVAVSSDPMQFKHVLMNHIQQGERMHWFADTVADSIIRDMKSRGWLKDRDTIMDLSDVPNWPKDEKDVVSFFEAFIENSGKTNQYPSKTAWTIVSEMKRRGWWPKNPEDQKQTNSHEWRDIGTAPKGLNDPVDLWGKIWIPKTDTFEGRRFTNCRWNMTAQKWYRSEVSDLPTDVRITHWMPITEGPLP